MYVCYFKLKPIKDMCFKTSLTNCVCLMFMFEYTISAIWSAKQQYMAQSMRRRELLSLNPLFNIIVISLFLNKIQ